jgi:diguanylate cyclase
VKQPLSVIFVDIDHFKSINDSCGHQAGDSVLVAVANILKAAMRASDVVARYGGDEFVCILPNADEQAAQMIGERLRGAIASKPLVVDNELEVSATASFGCATFSDKHPFESTGALLEQADRCLYAAKHGGRNRVVIPLQLEQESVETNQSASV